MKRSFMIDKKDIKKGEIAVHKKTLIVFLNSVKRFEDELDEIMKIPESHQRGKKIAEAMNKLTLSRHLYLRNTFDVPLNKLKDKILK